MTNIKNKGVRLSKTAYSLNDFLNDCKYHQEKIMIDIGAKESAKNSPLRLNGKKEILDFLAQHEEQDFYYVNTSKFRNGVKGEYPLVDSYKINLNFWDLYIAFCFIKTSDGWFIKSFHPDNSGETISLGEMILSKLLEEKK